MRARYYDPTTAQFITVDPAFTTTLAPYSYASDNPINMIDPLGLSWWNPASWNWRKIGKVAGYVALGAGAVGLGLTTFGVGDIALGSLAGIGGIADAIGVGGVYTGVAVDGLALGAGAIGTGVDCSNNPWSPKCGLDVLGMGLGGGGLGVDIAGSGKAWSLGLNGGAEAQGLGSLFWTDAASRLC